MKAVMGRLKTVYYNKLNGNVTYNAANVPIFREDADKIPSSHYILIRAGGTTPQRTAETFMRQAFLFIQIVSKFPASTGIVDSVVETIDEQIQELILPTPMPKDALADPSGLKIWNVEVEDELYETVVDTDFKYHIKTVRWDQLVIQQ